MMKLRKFPLFLVPLMALGFYSCIDSDQTEEAILEVDKREIADYLENNALDNVKELTDEVSGISIIWQEVSNSGQGASIGDTVSVNYTGKLLSNRVFDTSIEQVARDNNIFTDNRVYAPLTFPLGRGFLIQGFEYGVEQMEVGDKATVLMPSLFGYGSSPSGDIPANSPLIFELELIGVTEGPNQ